MDFSSVHNHHEHGVFQAVLDLSKSYPEIARNEEWLIDVACLALNRVTPRYIRHQADFHFYLTDKERNEHARTVNTAVREAFEFVRARAGGVPAN
ncbi:late competence development ComFB family protein [Aquincola sp. MAHUQ-54]|uniref:Late competence development ComFB family protein n=1 Tax=Aquincola agrisoli TaxID=3119538 RepID=A0AAW9QJS9_9BURK